MFIRENDNCPPYCTQPEQNSRIQVSNRPGFALPELNAPNALSPPGSRPFSESATLSRSCWIITSPYARAVFQLCRLQRLSGQFVHIVPHDYHFPRRLSKIFVENLKGKGNYFDNVSFSKSIPR